jgi:hypothetical protein
VDRYLENVRDRKHWKRRLAVVPLGLALIAWGWDTRNPWGIYLAFGLIFVTTVPYMRDDLRRWRNRKADRERASP